MSSTRYRELQVTIKEEICENEHTGEVYNKRIIFESLSEDGTQITTYPEIECSLSELIYKLQML